MLYASTRASLTRSLGASHFPTSIFATSLSDLTPSAYTAYISRRSESPPLSPNEREMADVKAAEREASGGYEPTKSTVNPLSRVELQWSDEVEHAVVKLGEGVGGRLVLIVSSSISVVFLTCSLYSKTIDPASEMLVLSSASYVTVNKLSSSLPPSQPGHSYSTFPMNID
jgi:twinfilin-like protein